jgi:glycerophosphoryl diester phosphodiesterase
MLETSPMFIKQFAGKQKPLLMAHRGNRVLFPENTIAAFRQAFIDGADILETDLHLSADGEFICIHDATIDRTTNGTGEVKDMTLKDLKNLQTLNPQSLPTEYQIPALNETSEILPATKALALELKTDRFLEPEICDRLGSLLREKNILDRTIALSFSLPRLLALKNSVPEIPVGWISMTPSGRYSI